MEDEKKCCCNHVPVWKILGTIVTVFLVVFMSVLTWNEVKKHDYIGRESQQTYTISIDGEGKINAVPDIAQISLGIETQKEKVADAQKENTDKMNKIIAQLKGAGIDAKDIQTANYNIYPRYDYSNGQQVLRGYTVSQSVTIKIRNLDKIGSIISQAGTLGANQIGSLNFTIDEPEKLKQQAREKALANAKEKAEALAKIAGVKLGKLVSFAESTQNSVVPVYRDYSMKSEAAVGVGGAAPAPAVEVGSQDIVVDVMVTYEVL
ncbi:MAG: SIMPL domain-containing protein [Candidatus Buchananbacteria bacterium]